MMRMLSARRSLAALAQPLSLAGQGRLFARNLSTAGIAHSPSQVRNVAVIAHVDHGKTTLVDKLIQAGGVLDNEDRVLDSGDMEKERGITIMSKTTRVDWQGREGDLPTVLNLVDTPGHSDFGGEVERVLSMVEGAVLLVDPSEGVMSQTKFVVSRALKQGLKIIVVLNKVDRDTARLNGDVENEIFDLFASLDATDEQLDFPIIYASAKYGWAVTDLHDRERETRGMTQLLQCIVDNIEPPCDEKVVEEPFSFCVNNMNFDSYLGRLITGKVATGTVRAGTKVHVVRPTTSLMGGAASDEAAVDATGSDKTKVPALATIDKLFCIRNGTERHEIEAAQAGDIVVMSGVPVEMVAVADTVCDPSITTALPTVPMTPPTLAMSFGANDGPLGGRSGGVFVNANQVKARLTKEVENNVTLLLRQNLTDTDQLEVHAKGELQLGILIEEMRREKYEMCVSPPRILTVPCPETGDMLEPIEEVTIDVDQEQSGTVIERLNSLRAPMLEYKEMGDRVRLIFDVPSRLLLGIRAALRNDTRGSAVVNSMFKEYAKPEGGAFTVNDKGKIVSCIGGIATDFALNSISARGTLFIEPGTEVYEGMVIGESSRPGDMEVNPVKGKKLTNVRSAGADEKSSLPPPRKMSLEDYIIYMDQDEVLEVTPNAIRLRKKILDEGERKRVQRQNAQRRDALKK